MFVVFLVALFYLVVVRHVVQVEEVRRVVAATGPAAPLAYVVVSAVLGAIFVPGPILAATSGLLFGPLLGVFVTLGATVGTAVVASLVGRRAGRDSARALLGAERAARVDALIDRGGLWAVVGQRFVPGISDALASCVRGVRGSVVADGCWRVHRFGAAGVCLHRVGRIDRESVTFVGVHGYRGVVRDCDCRCVRCAAWVSEVACAFRATGAVLEAGFRRPVSLA